MLREDEIKRYSRHIRLAEIGEKGQEKFKKAKVLVVGVGGLGCPVLLYLTAAGIGTIGILDYDTVDESNLHRQILFGTHDIDKPKVFAAKERLEVLNPFIDFKIHFVKLTKNNALDIFKEYDIIVEGSDNFPTRYLTNDACVLLKKPLVYGAVERFNGQLTVFNYHNGPTLRCLCPNPPDPLETPSCSDVGIMGVMPGMIGTMQANEVIKIITGIGNVLSGKLLLLDALNFKMDIVNFSRDEQHANITELKDYTDFCISAANIKEITSDELNRKLEDGKDFQIIDVRDPEEYNNFDLKRELIPLSEIPENNMLVSKEKPVVFVCNYGIKSMSAINYLQKRFGCNNLLSLRNGIAEWNVLFGKK
ncbi:MAG: molybdopterin-synthase adenylyltransferase MoeB [Bacteroidia bacterium]|nr:molybdopterin-synthase adenylyltransferase MoeB [Bacteroidia bacterium]